MKGPSMPRAILLGLAILAGSFAATAVIARVGQPTDPEPETAALPSVDALVAQFDQLAFRGHHRNRISRWYGPINLVLDASSDRTHTPEFKVDLLAMELRRATGFIAVPIFDRDAQSPGNAIRLYVGGPKAEQLIQQRFQSEGDDWCAMVRVRKRNDPRPHRGTVAATGEFAETHVSPCLMWGVAGVLGLHGPACRVRPSSFCEADPKDRIYPFDLLLLEALFHPEIQPGMPRNQALPIVRAFFTEKIRALQANPGRHDRDAPHWQVSRA